SRAGRPSSPFLNAERVQETIEKSRALNEIAQRRGQTLAEMAVAWILRDGKVTSVLIGASRVSQIDDNVKALENLDFTNEELDEIEAVLAK
ncbi:MAG: aldo/keto reductase, partial [Trichococcus sp.]